jgi:hypothetical protein
MTGMGKANLPRRHGDTEKSKTFETQRNGASDRMIW